MSKKTLFVILSFSPFLFSCVSLKEVNQYAASSVTSLNKINDINYSFSDYCQRDCELQQLRSGKIDTLFKCNCEPLAAKADEAVQKIHYTITSYLRAIEQLTNNKGFTYDVSNLSAALQANPLIKLTPAQDTIFTNAGNFIATAATAFYRKRKLKQYLNQADPVFQSLTETFIYLIDNRLKSQLKISYDTRFANLNQMLENANDNKGFKQFVIKVYLDERAYYKKHVALLESYAALLKTVKRGHHDLYLQRNNLKDTKVKELVKRYAEDVQDIVANVKKY